MNWKDKIIAGMELISQGCKENHRWNNCIPNCPFTAYCDVIWGEFRTEADECFKTPADYFSEDIKNYHFKPDTYLDFGEDK